MKESVCSLRSVAVMLRLAQNTRRSSSNLPGLTGVSTVMAVTLPSMLATAEGYIWGARNGVRYQRAPNSNTPSVRVAPCRAKAKSRARPRGRRRHCRAMHTRFGSRLALCRSQPHRAAEDRLP
jgi:hypothetical protein